MTNAALSKIEITSRLNAIDDAFGIYPRPGDDAIGPGTIDLRVGSAFLAAERSSAPSVVASDPQAARKLFGEVRIRRGYKFVMQPRQFVLASTFEYIAMPNDLVGLIQSRSTYGRMGIISATAAFVGPGYKGCPTLELVNVGEVAVELDAYEPICQLILLSTEQPPMPPSRYQCATRPEFARSTRR